MTEEEEPSFDAKRSKKGSEKAEDNRNAILKLFMDQNNNPKWESWLILAISVLAAYYLATFSKPAKEITYVEFINNYITKNNVKLITIAKDRRSDSFNYRAEIDAMDDSEKVYITLGSVDNFLAKLDYV